MGLANPRIFPDVSYYFQCGTSPFEAWYLAGGIQGNTPNTGSLPINELHALPFISGRGGKLDRIAFEVTTGGGVGSVGRCGIYASTSNENLYPNELVVDSGEFDCTTVGVKSATIDVTLVPNRIYWAVLYFGTAAPTFRRPAASTLIAPLGHPSTLGGVSNRRLTNNRAYSALPSTFPAGSSAVSGLFGVWLRHTD